MPKKLSKRITKLRRKGVPKGRKSETEETLRKNEEKYRTLIEGLNEAVYRMSLPDGKYEYMSPACKEVLGYSAKKFLDNSLLIKKIMHPDFRNYFKEKWGDLIKGKVPPTYTYKIIGPKGNERWITQSNKGVFDNKGKIIAIEGICRNITERKKAEEALRASERKYRTLIGSSHEVIFSKDRDGYYHTLNLIAAIGLGGACIKDVEGKTDYDLLPKKQADALRKIDKQIMESGKDIEVEEVVRNAQGENRIYLSHKWPTYDNEGRITGIACFAMDITERKKAEEELREREERLRAIFETAQDSIFIKDYTLRYIQVNSAMERLFKLPSSELLGKTDEELFGKETAVYLRKTDSRVLEGEVVEEESVKPVNGIPLAFHVIKVPIRDSSGEIIGLCGIARDITKRKKAEEALQESEEKYRLVSENIPVVVYSALPDKRSTNLFVSGGVEELTGYTVKHFMEDPKLWNNIVHPDDQEYVWQKIEEHRKKKIPLNVEYRIISKDKKLKWIKDEAIPMLDKNGYIVRVDGFMENITERKRAHEALKESLKEKEVLLREIHHRVKNNMQIISSLLNLQAKQGENKQMSKMFQDSQERVRSMALVHEMLYKSKDMARVNVAEYVQDIARQLMISYGISRERIKLNVKIKNVFLDVNKAIPCGLIINELVSNALKHAFEKKEQGKINIEFEVNKKNKHTLLISDTGIGLPKNIDIRKSKTLGLQLVNTLVEQLNGCIEVNRKGGTTFKITFKSTRE